jgi:putative transposase
MAARAAPTGRRECTPSCAATGVRVGRKRVERLMRARGLRGAFVRKRWRCSTRQDPRAIPAPDLAGRDFTAVAPSRLWVAGISKIPTGEGALWLASVRDAFSRRIVGWKASDRADTELLLGALEYAVWGRDIDRDQRKLIHHSDRGCQYTAVRFTGAAGRRRHPPLHGHGRRLLRQRPGRELLLRVEDRAGLPHQLPHPRGGRAGPGPLHRRLVSPHRIQRALGWRSPDEYEAAYHATLPTQPGSSSMQTGPLGAK